MSKKHEHKEPVVCKHEHLKYCAKCRVVECEECGAEFSAKTTRNHIDGDVTDLLRRYQEERDRLQKINLPDGTIPWPPNKTIVTFSADPVPVTVTNGDHHNVCH